MGPKITRSLWRNSILSTVAISVNPFPNFARVPGILAKTQRNFLRIKGEVSHILGEMGVWQRKLATITRVFRPNSEK